MDYFGDKVALRQLLTVEPVRATQAESFLADITATKDSSADVRDIADAQEHLTPQQCGKLYDVLKKRKKLFDGSLGCYTGRKFHIDLKPGTVPFHCKQPYSIPVNKLDLAKSELERQCDIGVLQQVYESEWGMPMLVIPKKDGAIRTCADVRELNKHTVCLTYPLPRIQNIFHR